MGKFSDVVDDWDMLVGRQLDDRMAHSHLPLLSQLLSGPSGQDIAAEIAQLVAQTGGHFRARRRNVELMGQVDAPGYHRNVVIRDISGSGARLRVARTGVLDVMQADDMRLRCRVEPTEELPAGQLDLGLSLVRVVDTAARHMELAYQFRHVSPRQEALIDRISDMYFVH